MGDCDCMNVWGESEKEPLSIKFKDDYFLIEGMFPSAVSDGPRVTKAYAIEGLDVSAEKYAECLKKLLADLEKGTSHLSAIISFITCLLVEQESPDKPEPPAPGYTPGSWRRC